MPGSGGNGGTDPLPHIERISKDYRNSNSINYRMHLEDVICEYIDSLLLEPGTKNRLYAYWDQLKDD